MRMLEFPRVGGTCKFPVKKLYIFPQSKQTLGVVIYIWVYEETTGLYIFFLQSLSY